MKEVLKYIHFLRGLFILLLYAIGVEFSWGQNYKLITSVAELEAGKTYIVASMQNGDGYVMKGYESGNNCKQIAATATNKIILYEEGMGKFTLDCSYGPWTFYDGNYYLDATSTTSDNHLKGSEDVDKYNTFSISFSYNEAIITCTGKDKRNIIQYNPDAQLFSCYTSGQSSVYLYKETDAVTSLSITGSPTDTEYYVGDKPNAIGLKITATYSNGSQKDVTSEVEWTFTPSIIESNTTNVTATAKYEGIYIEKSFPITVKSIANTIENPYSIDEAISYIEQGNGLSEEVFVKGIISKVDNLSDGCITYWISNDGQSNSQQFQCYRGLNKDEQYFSSSYDLKIGSLVVVRGILMKSGSIYGFAENNVIISNDETNAITLASISITGDASIKEYEPNDKPSSQGYIVTATFSDGSTRDITNEAIWSYTPQFITLSTTEVTATASYGNLYATVTFAISVSKENLVYHLVPKAEGDNGYATASNITIRGVTWNITGNSLYEPWRIGGNQIYKTNRDIKTTTPIYGCIEKIIVCVGEKFGEITLNSLTLSVADDINGNNAITYTQQSPLANTDYIFEIPPSTNAYYKISYNVTVHGSSNAFYYFNGAKFFGKLASTSSSITDAQYATMCLPYNAIVPEGVTAYTATNNGEFVLLTEKEDKTIAAYEGVVLKGKPGTYTFVATEKEVQATQENEMVGVIDDSELSSENNVYLLTRNKADNTIAFRKLGTNYTLGANKAYLKPKENNARELYSVIWNDNSTGIDKVKDREEVEDKVVYNLSGQRLKHVQKGINIINGELVIK